MYPSFIVDITDPGVYSFNMSAYCDYSTSSVSLQLMLYETSVCYVPQLDDYTYSNHYLNSYFWWTITTGWTGSHYFEFTAVRQGSLVIELQGIGIQQMDQISINFTVSQLLSLSSATQLALGSLHTYQWTQEDTWKAYQVTIPSPGLYNVTLENFLPYNTTGSWIPSFVSPFDEIQLIDLQYGTLHPYISWQPFHFVPNGESNSTDTESQFLSIEAGDYYFLVKSEQFLYLNGTYTNLTLCVEPITPIPLNVNQPLQLNFSQAWEGFYISLQISQGHLYNLYFDTPIGFNWTVESIDVLYSPSTSIPPQFTYYQYPTFNQTTESKVRNATLFLYEDGDWGYQAPWWGLRGESYQQTYSVIGTYTSYSDGVPVFSSFVQGMEGHLSTSFFYVQAYPIASPSSSTFNITLHLEEVGPFTQLTTNGYVFSANFTEGPLCHFFEVPLLSGYIYEVSATATAYTSYGSVTMTGIPKHDSYKNWFVLSTPSLIKVLPPSYYPGATSAVNESAVFRIMSVRNDTAYFIVYPFHFFYPSDTEEVAVNLTITPPTPYTLGSDISVTLHDYDFAGFTVPVVAGYSYRLTLSADATAEIYATFFDDLGHTPFDVTEINLWAMAVAQSDMNFTATATSLRTSTVTLVIVGSGTVRFTFDVLDSVPPTVEITSPSDGAILTPGIITIQFAASDVFGLSSLTITIDGTSHSLSVTDTSYDWDATTTPAGLHTIVLTATDVHGNTATTSITILLAPEPGSYQQGWNAAFLYLIIGVPVALVLGLVIGYLIKRRKS